MIASHGSALNDVVLNDLSSNQELRVNPGDWPEPFVQAGKILEATRGMGYEAQKDAIANAKRELGAQTEAWRLFTHGPTRRLVLRVLTCVALRGKMLQAKMLVGMLLGPAGGVSIVLRVKEDCATY